jgi:hypothetical protein
VTTSAKARRPGQATLSFSTPASVTVGAPLHLSIALSDAELLTQSSFAVEYDPELLTFASASEGELFKRDGTATSFQQAPAKPGSISFTLQRARGATGVTGDGTLAQLTFVTKKPGPVGLGFGATTLTRQDGSAQPVTGLSSFVDLIAPRVD